MFRTTDPLIKNNGKLDIMVNPVSYGYSVKDDILFMQFTRSTDRAEGEFITTTLSEMRVQNSSVWQYPQREYHCVTWVEPRKRGDRSTMVDIARK